MYIECIGDDLMNELVISIKNAYKKFGEQVVLNDVSLEIYKGRIYGIIGRNGSGKTVLFKSICGFILLDSGEITVSDKVIGKDVDMPKNVGLIIETPGFLKDYSAYWNLKFLADLNKKITNDDITSHARLPKPANRLPNTEPGSAYSAMFPPAAIEFVAISKPPAESSLII